MDVVRCRLVSTLLVVVLLVAVAGCAKASQKPATAVAARRAFEALYPGFRATSAEASGNAWVVRGLSRSDFGRDSAVKVRVPVTRDGTGAFHVVVDGVRWSGTADLQALLQVKEGDHVMGVVKYYLEPGSQVVDVRSEARGVVVSVVTKAGPQPPLVVKWDPSGGWVPEIEFTADQWRHEAEAFGTALQLMALGVGSSAPEPKGSPKPVSGVFTADILAADQAKRTVTIDRIQYFNGDGADRAAAEDGAQASPSGTYTRNHVRERTVLRVSRHAVAAAFYFGPDWQPVLGIRHTVPVSAMDTEEFFHEYRTESAYREMLRGIGAWLVVAHGQVIFLVSNYTPG